MIRSHPGSGLDICGAETGAKLCERAAHDNDGNHSPTSAHQHGDTAVPELQRVAAPPCTSPVPSGQTAPQSDVSRETSPTSASRPMLRRRSTAAPRRGSLSELPVLSTPWAVSPTSATYRPHAGITARSGAAFRPAPVRLTTSGSRPLETSPRGTAPRPAGATPASQSTTSRNRSLRSHHDASPVRHTRHRYTGTRQKRRTSSVGPVARFT